MTNKDDKNNLRSDYTGIITYSVVVEGMDIGFVMDSYEVAFRMAMKYDGHVAKNYE